jgi:putative nucleotidyltransferase with HDIG domain
MSLDGYSPGKVKYMQTRGPITAEWVMRDLKDSRERRNTKREEEALVSNDDGLCVSTEEVSRRITHTNIVAEGICKKKNTDRSKALRGQIVNPLLFNRLKGLNLGIDTDDPQLETKMTRIPDYTIMVIWLAINSIVPHLAQHEFRVSELATAVGRKLKISADELRSLKNASLLHDIGKVEGDEFFDKQGQELTTKEYRSIQMHPVIGAEKLRGILPKREVKIIEGHHERWDGSGYPYGLRQEENDPLARILQVCDSVDAAMTRTYSRFRTGKPALTRDQISREIQQFAGILYDPAVVKACVEVIESTR